MDSNVILVVVMPFIHALLAWLFPRFSPYFGASAPIWGFIMLIFCDVNTVFYISDLLFGVHFGLDNTGWMMLALSTCVWLISGIFGIKENLAWNFWFFWALCFGGVAGACMSLDLASFYTFFTIMSLGAYPLIIAKKSTESLYAGKVYLIFALIGEMAILAGILGIVGTFGELGFSALESKLAPSWALIMLMIGFGIKVGVAGLHVWLPLAHSIAPASASAVLSGVMLKVGFLGWLRLGQMDLSQVSLAGIILIGLGIIGMFGGVISGLGQRELKSILAYSSVSQMGIFTLGFGAMLHFPQSKEAISGALLIYALHHGFVKSGLFLAAGAGVKKGISKIGFIISLLLAFAISGGAFSSGAAAKSTLKASIAQTPWASGLSLALLAGMVASTILMVYFLQVLYKTHKKTLILFDIPIFLALIGSIWIAIEYGASFKMVDTIALLIGVGVAFVNIPWLQIPKGDILSLMPRFYIKPHVRKHFSTPISLPLHVWGEKIVKLEVWMGNWGVSMLLWLGVLALAIGAS
jgi:formate hydrogenlyase subunit 3/multisubunit Na+/H+ antiporter MnhD subunit